MKRKDKSSSILPSSRIKQIAKQDKNIAGLSQDAVHCLGHAANILMQELIQGTAKEVREKRGGKADEEKMITLTPEDIRSHILSNPQYKILKDIAEASKDPQFLEGYRARTRAAGGHSGGSKKRRKQGGLIGEGGGLDEEEEEEDDKVVGEGEERGGTLALDEDYDDD